MRWFTESRSRLREPSERSLLALLIVLFAGTSVVAQEVRDYGTSSRGLLGSESDRAAAVQAITRSGVVCEIIEARLRGRDAAGGLQHEVTCRDGPGYIVFDKPDARAVNCLALADRDRRSSAGGRCRLPRNRDARGLYAEMAEKAKIDCFVQAGRLVGLVDGQETYEIGCVDEAGYWVRRNVDGWVSRGCTDVIAEGGVCTFTSKDELLGLVTSWFINSPLASCQPTDYVAMGSNASGGFYELICQDARHLVVRIGPDKQLAEVIPCAVAADVGAGCTLFPRQRNRLSFPGD